MTTADVVEGLIRSDLTADGIRRRRCGKGFCYYAADGTRLTDPETLNRVRALVIPPAWEDVWISPLADGHIQAVGTDAAGRRQYRYHDLWRAERDKAKHDRILPKVREVVERHLTGDKLSRERVLAAAVRLIDLGFFRIGGEEYAAENGTFGLATIRKEHVTCHRGQLVFDYTGKSSKHREQFVADPEVCTVVNRLKRRRGDPNDELLAFRRGQRWHDVSSADINDYLREVADGDYSAKDFRTWHATVLAAVGLAVSEPAATSESARKRAVARVVQEVASYLGNTPAVARASYIDPRIISLYERGITIAPSLTELGEGQEFGDVATNGQAEQAVLKLISEHPEPAIDQT
jgi:DNA topoisomerase IB